MKKLKYFSLLLTFVWSVLIGIILISTIPSPFSLDFDTKNYSKNLLPEGWGFFTKNPWEELPDIISIVDGESISNIKPCSSSEYYFGLARECRMYGAELGDLINKIEDSLWTEGNHLQSKMTFSDKVKTIEVTNNFKDANFFGDFYLVKKERIPWAWSKDYRKIVPKYKYVKVLIRRD